MIVESMRRGGKKSTKLNIREAATEKKDGGILGKMASIPQLIKHDEDYKHKEQKPL